jgi:hypothetical protein
MLTVISIASVVAVYAITIGTYNGLEVTVGGGASAEVTYSTDQSGWTTTLSVNDNETSWYSKLNIDGGQYSGTTVTITWQLQRKVASTWTDVGTATITSMSLPDTQQDVYATGNGQSTGNRDWSADATLQGTYRVVAIVSNSA